MKINLLANVNRTAVVSQWRWGEIAFCLFVEKYSLQTQMCSTLYCGCISVDPAMTYFRFGPTKGEFQL